MAAFGCDKALYTSAFASHFAIKAVPMPHQLMTPHRSAYLNYALNSHLVSLIVVMSRVRFEE